MCQDITLKVAANGGGITPDVFAGLWPSVLPGPASPSWSNRNFGSVNDSDTLIISAYDTEFRGGTRSCGLNGSLPCVLYVAVSGRCATGSGLNASGLSTFLLTATQTAAPNALLSTPRRGDAVAANSYTYYRFCNPEPASNIRVALANPLDSCTCGTSYAWPELLVSKRNAAPNIKSKTWKLAQIERRYVDIKSEDNDADTWAGGKYYVGVFGWCTPFDYCPDPCTCGPCSNYAETRYALEVQLYSGNQTPPAVPTPACPTARRVCSYAVCPAQVSKVSAASSVHRSAAALLLVLLPAACVILASARLGGVVSW